jgi:octaprenyl-diphosphate synthase
VLVAYQAGGAGDRDFWRRTIEANEQTDADLDRALHLMGRCGAIRATLDRAAGFIAAAKAALAEFPDSALRRALLDVADYTVSRAR